MAQYSKDDRVQITADTLCDMKVVNGKGARAVRSLRPGEEGRIVSGPFGQPFSITLEQAATGAQPTEMYWVELDRGYRVLIPVSSMRPL